MDASPAGASALRDLESELTAFLTETVDEVEHSEFFDGEQRAELHTILKAMLADTQHHRYAIEQLLSRLTKEAGDV